jgi:signal transduction histidine kinase/DNA-binding response OmpR family regulator
MAPEVSRSLHPHFRSDLESMGIDPEVPLSAEAWARLSGHVSVVYGEREAARGQQLKLEQELEDLRLVAKASANSEKARAQFIANMSHELRTPMNAIIGYSEMLGEELGELGQPDLVEDVRRVERSGRHLLRLINDILDLSKIDAGKMEIQRDRIDVTALAHEVQTAVSGAAQDQANQLVLEIAPDVSNMISDAGRIRQCLTNLLSNAIKFTQGGTVHLRIARSGRWHRFEVQDTGIGMSLQQQQRVFAEFTQADGTTTRRFGGTGLGLTLSRKFAEMMGGQITLESEEGHGSTFVLELPDLTLSPERGAELARHAADMVPGERIVLAIDDDPDVIDLVSRILSRDGFTVAGALDGESALELATRLKPSAILLDVVLPGMSGWEVLSKLKQDRALSQIPVVMLSTVDDRTRGLSLGASEYLVKPIERDQLVTSVQRLYRSDVGQDVLVIDDDYATRRLLRRYLQRDGFTVRTAAHGAEALDEMNRQSPGLVLLDLMMPVMDGLEFLERLRAEARWDDVPVVVTTAKDLTPEERQSLSSSVSTVLSKHAHSMDQILTEVRQLAGQLKA